MVLHRSDPEGDPIENHKLLYIFFIILARIPIEKQMDPRSPIAFRMRSELPSVKYVDAPPKGFLGPSLTEFSGSAHG